MSSLTSHRIAAAAARLDAGWSIVSGADSVCAASGHIVPIETGASPFAGGPSLAIVGPDGALHLVVSNLESAAAAATDADRVTEYIGFSADRPEPYLEHYAAAVSSVIEATGMRDRVAVEADSLPWSVGELLRTRGIAAVDGTAEFARARMIKAPAQLAALRRSAALAALAQHTAVAAAEPGMSELELFSTIRGAVESAAGERVAFAGDLLSGIERTSKVGGWATGRRIEADDMIVADLAPRVAGYWSDSCATFVVGRATDRFARLHALASTALHAGIDAAKPGVPVNEIDRVVRSTIAAEGFEYGHHTGHGIGTSVHEFPRIIPGEDTPLETGMVILLEPGVYEPGVGGVRLEWMFEVTDHGLERLTDFEHTLEPR
ncbi:M24 family metallopeptidase [uncultured Amnibacterium sp.]|uniref:M24 family metallopeptidase n=1 Tax=uncultured Amnibacterium sp. TaxID=1631851 RepID=UPI0035CAA07C